MHNGYLFVSTNTKRAIIRQKIHMPFGNEKKHSPLNLDNVESSSMNDLHQVITCSQDQFILNDKAL